MNKIILCLVLLCSVAQAGTLDSIPDENAVTFFPATFRGEPIFLGSADDYRMKLDEGADMICRYFKFQRAESYETNLEIAFNRISGAWEPFWRKNQTVELRFDRSIPRVYAAALYLTKLTCVK